MGRVRVDVDGQNLDVTGNVAVNMRSMNLSNITQVRAPFTHTIHAADSLRNREIFNNPGVFGIQEPGAYSKKRVSINYGGVPLLQNGKMTRLTFGDTFEIGVTGRSVEFYETIKNKKLRDIDFGSENSFAFSRSWPSYIEFPHIETTINPDYSAVPAEGTFNPVKHWVSEGRLIPFIKKKELIYRIFLDSGYAIDASRLFDFDHYERSYISLQVPEGNGTHTTIKISEWMHDISQGDFLKSVLNQYNATLIFYDKQAHIIPVRSIMSIKGSAYQWSDKLDKSSNPDISYDTGYAVTNYYEYKEWDEELESDFDQLIDMNSANTATDVRASRKWWITSENKNLSESREVSKLIFHPAMEFKILNTDSNPRQVLYIPCFDASTSKFANQYPIHDVLIPTSGTTYKDSGGSDETWFGGVTNGDIYPAFFRSQEAHSSVDNQGMTEGLSWNVHLLPTFYPSWATKHIRKPLKVSCRLNLDVMDVQPFADTDSFSNSNDLRYVTPVWIKEFGEYFFVDKISSFQPGRASKVDLIRI